MHFFIDLKVYKLERSELLTLTLNIISFFSFFNNRGFKTAKNKRK